MLVKHFLIISFIILCIDFFICNVENLRLGLLFDYFCNIFFSLFPLLTSKGILSLKLMGLISYFILISFFSFTNLVLLLIKISSEAIDIWWFFNQFSLCCTALMFRSTSLISGWKWLRIVNLISIVSFIYIKRNITLNFFIPFLCLRVFENFLIQNYNEIPKWNR